MYRTAVALCFAVAVAAGLSAQNPPATTQDQPDVRFKVEVNYVEIDAVVTDAQGNFVRDLKPEEFQVLEDGTPQEVTAFTLVDLPVERLDTPLFAPEAAVPDVRSNAREFNGRLYLILLDDLHTAPLRSAHVKAAARLFIQGHVAANDLVAVVMTSGRTDASQDFTGDKRMLLNAVDKFMGRKLRSATQEKYEEYQRRRGTPMASDPLRDPLDPERGSQARSMLSTVKNAAEWMGGIRGRRKSVILIGEGIDYDINNVFEATYASTIRDEIRDAIAAATRGNVTLYAVDPRGLNTVGDEAMELGAPPEDPSLRLDSSGLRDEFRLSQDSLRIIAEQTGGIAVLNQNDLRPGFDRIQQENSSYYLLGYYSSNERRDGRFRNLAVRVTRPGLEVRARKGYVAPRGRAATPPPTVASIPAALRDALASPIPVSGLPMRVFAAAFKGTRPNASVLVNVELEPRVLPFQERDGHFENNVELWITAVDHRGQTRDGHPSTLQLKLRPPTRAAVEAHGLRVTQRLTLPPGRYQIRVGALETNGGAVGTVTYDLTVPDFHKAPLEMSGVVLASIAAGQVPTLTADADLQEALQAPPTAVREFGPGDVLRAYAEVYNARGGQPHRVDINASVKVDGGRSVFTHSEERGTEELQGARGGFGYRVDVPLRDLAPGLYVLTIEARSRLSGNATVRRDIPFRITAGAGQPPTVTRQPQAEPRTARETEQPREPASAPGGPAAQERAMPAFQTVDQGLMSGFEEPRQAVVRTDEDWKTLWRTHAPNRPVPPVDFSKQAIVAVFLGSRTTAGYSVSIDRIEPLEEGVRVVYQERRPTPGDTTAQVLTSPFHIVATAAFAGPARFEHASDR